MIGGFGFARSRARAALPALVTLAVVTALTGLLLSATVTGIAAAEAREVRAALVAVSPERAGLVIDPRDGDPRAVADAAGDALAGAAVHIDLDGQAVVVRPDTAAITGAGIRTVDAALPGFAAAVGERAGSPVQVSGGLAATAGDIVAAIDARRGPAAVALALIGVIAGVVVSAVAVETVRVRAEENRLLRARGARRSALLALAGGEAAAVTAVAAIVGAGIGAVAAAALGGVTPDIVAALVVAACVTVAAATVAAVATVRGIDRRRTRAGAVADVGVAVLLAALTAVSAWRFADAGTPLADRGDGSLVFDPLVALAPALVLALGALVALALATPVARIVAATAGRTRGISPVTPLRMFARRPGRHALSIVVVAFAVGTLGITGTYAATVAALGDTPEQLRVGADVRVGTIPADVDTTAVADTGPASAAMRVRAATARTADGRESVLAVEASALGAVLSDADGALDPAALGRALAIGDVGAPLAGDTLAFTLRAPVPLEVVDGIEIAAEPTAVRGRVALLGPDGTLVHRAFSNIDGAGDDGVPVRARDPEAVEIPLPAGGPWALAGVDIAAEAAWTMTPDVSVTDLSSGGAAVEVDGFRPVVGTEGEVTAEDGALVFRPVVDPRGAAPWTRAVTPGVPSPVPAVLTADVAAALGLGVGDRFAFALTSPDADLDIDVAAIVPILPGASRGEGMLVDLATLTLTVPVDVVPDQVWFATDDPRALAAAVAERFPSTVTIVADPRAADEAASTSFAFVLAAAGAVLLAVTVLLLRRSQNPRDGRETALLAVLGLGRRRAARVRAREDLLAVVTGLLAGIAAGAATAWLAVPGLARAAYATLPPTFAVPLSVPVGTLAAALAGMLVLCGGIVLTVRTPPHPAALLREDG